MEESLKRGKNRRRRSRSRSKSNSRRRRKRRKNDEGKKDDEGEKKAPGEVIKVVHNDGDKQIEHDEGAEEDEGHKVDVGSIGAAGLVWVDEEPGGIVPLICPVVTGPARQPGKHDVRPGLARGTPGAILLLKLFQILC